MIDVVSTEDLLYEEDSTELSVDFDSKRELMSFDKLMSTSTMLAKATMIPVTYQNRPENCFIALDMAQRMNVSPMMVMQQLYVIQGKPSWSGQALASLIRNSKQFKEVELNFVGTEGQDDWGAYVTAIRVSTGKKLKGATVTIRLSKEEGWYAKAGSKWKTMPELMLSYRAYAFFQRVHAPELSFGLMSAEEVEDISYEKEKVVDPYENR